MNARKIFGLVCVLAGFVAFLFAMNSMLHTDKVALALMICSVVAIVAGQQFVHGASVSEMEAKLKVLAQKLGLRVETVLSAGIHDLEAGLENAEKAVANKLKL